MVTLTHFITTYHISLVKVQTNYCNNNLLILDVKQLNKINIFFIIKKKALLARVKLRCIMGCRVKKQLSGKRYIAYLPVLSQHLNPLGHPPQPIRLVCNYFQKPTTANCAYSILTNMKG